MEKIHSTSRSLKKSNTGFIPLEPIYGGRKALTGFTPLERKHSSRNRSLTGFTLIELMLVVIIIGALVAMVMPRLAGRSEQARVAAAQADISSNIATALKLYELDNGAYPSNEAGLNALLSRPSNVGNWNGPYLEKKPLDPWGREYQYKRPGTHRTHDYDLSSLGKDGQASSDDVVNW